MKPRLRCLSALLCAACIVCETQGAGYFNMPTNLRQCLGYGYGPGYHAPMLLGPAMQAGIEAKRLRRMPAALASPPRACAHGPSAYQAGAFGAGGGGWESYLVEPQPAVLAPALTPGPLYYAPGGAATGFRSE